MSTFDLICAQNIININESLHFLKNKSVFELFLMRSIYTNKAIIFRNKSYPFSFFACINVLNRN